MGDDRALREAIRDHYDRLSGLYLEFWGEHLHHGLFDEGASPAAAQVRLVEHVAARTGIASGERVLDVGCGLGGSARWLAEQLACPVLGITISPVQAAMARELTQRRRLDALVSYALVDANRLACAPASFDVVWVIECSEHLADKAAFFASCAALLRPGGRLAVCTWLAPDEGCSEDAAVVRSIADAMVCPSIGSRREYLNWIDRAGLDLRVADDLTDRVVATWDHCLSLTGGPIVRTMLRTQSHAVQRFVDSFGLMRDALMRRVLRYGLFVAERRGRVRQPAG